MREMEWWLFDKYVLAKNKVRNFLEKENGESNIIAIILVILVVIALAAVFKEQITELVKNLFKQINAETVGKDLMDSKK